MTRTERAALADGLVALAIIACYSDRKVLLCTAVLLRESGTLATARNHITGWPGPPEVKAGVVRMLGLLDERKAS